MANINKIEYEMRVNQAVLQYGPGAMVEFKDQVLMTAAPKQWNSNTIEIRDYRLESRLKVWNFKRPADKKGIDGEYHGLSFVRFPEWYFCPSCGKFQTLEQWKAEYDSSQLAVKDREKDPEMATHLNCYNSKCNKRNLVVARFVVVCPHGHIDDFPWIDFVHKKNGVTNCISPKIVISNSRSESLDGIQITCMGCNKTANLSKILDPKEFNKLGFTCSGRHPWKYEKQYSTGCKGTVTAILRGSSAVYFPLTMSSLVIPAPSIKKDVLESDVIKDFLTKAVSTIEDTKNSAEDFGITDEVQIKQSIDKKIASLLDNYAEKIRIDVLKINTSNQTEIENKEKEIKEILIARLEGTDSTDDEFTYREEEFKSLNGENNFTSKDFNREEIPIQDYYKNHLNNFVTKVSLIHKIREVEVLLGFSRTHPISYSKGIQSLGDDRPNTVQYVNIKEYNEHWYPGYEVRGEGIFIEFNAKQITEWEKTLSVKERFKLLQRNYNNSSKINNEMNDRMSAGFVLLHTISHLLINQLIADCGYEISSLKEKIYYGINNTGKKRAGIFIYTASGDTEGSLGGLVRQGRPDVFPRMVKKAFESAYYCSNDPVCSCSTGQGDEGLNLAACHSCVLLPETSCEQFNILLDRALLVGSLDSDSSCGFLDYCNQNQMESTPEKKYEKLDLREDGTDFSSSYKEIWETMFDEDEELEDNFKKSILQNIEKFEGKEKPLKDTKFIIGSDPKEIKCALLWSKSKVIYFSALQKENYEKIIERNVETGWIFFCRSNENLQYDDITSKLVREDE